MKINHLFDAKVIFKYGQQRDEKPEGLMDPEATYINTSF